MKQLVLLFLASAFFCSCKKDGQAVPEMPEPSFTIVKTYGDAQFDLINSTISPIGVTVADSLGSAVANAWVKFTVKSGGGRVTKDSILTDRQGFALTNWKLGPAEGTQQLTVSARYAGGKKFVAVPVEFTALATDSLTFNIYPQGDKQTAPYNQPLDHLPAVFMMNRAGTKVVFTGLSVEFKVIAGGGTTNGIITTTGTMGQYHTTWALGNGPGVQKLQVLARNPAGRLMARPVEITASRSGAAGQGTTVAGGNGVGPAANQLSAPLGMFMDVAGNLYVCDSGNDRIQKFAPGAVNGVTVAGGNGRGSAANQLASPAGVFIDHAGALYIADTGNGRVQKWLPGGNSGVTVAGGNGSTIVVGNIKPNMIGLPKSVVVDGSGAVYVADAGLSRVQKWVPGSNAGVTLAGGIASNVPYGNFIGGGNANQLWQPNDLQLTSSGAVIIADAHNNRISQWLAGATSGTVVAGGYGYRSDPFLVGTHTFLLHIPEQFGDACGSADNQFYFVSGVAIDAAGNIFGADKNNHRIMKWAPGSKTGIPVAGANGPGIAANQLNLPERVLVSPNGTIYIADTGNNRIQKWVP